MTQAQETQPVPGPGVAGYSVVLPPGWARIPVRQGSAGAIRAVVAESLKTLPANVPRDRVAPYRAELEGRLRAMVTRARSQGGVDVYLPAAPMHGIAVSASFVVSEGTLGDPAQDVDPVQVVTYLATEDHGGQDGAAVSSAPVTVDGAAAVRQERTAQPEADAGLDAGSRRVDYIIPVPGDPGRWLFVTFSAHGAEDPGDRFAGILVDLFDAIMSTFRWSYS